MKILEQGGLTIVAGTVIASALILMTGKDEAGENEQAISISVKDKLLSISSQVGSDVASANNPITTNTESIAISPPPPGPFFVVSNLNLIQNTRITSINIDSPIAPEAPAPEIVKQPIAPEAKSLNGSISKLVAPVEPIALGAPKMVPEAKPKLKQVVAPKPVLPVQKTIAAQPLNTNGKMSPQQLTKMQKAPILPNMKDQPQMPQKFVRQNINNQKQNNLLMQRYMVVPAPVYVPNYINNYPQMPIYGNPYYYAPLQYMPSMQNNRKIQSNNTFNNTPPTKVIVK